MIAYLREAFRDEPIPVSRGPRWDPAITRWLVCVGLASLVGAFCYLGWALADSRTTAYRREQALCGEAARYLVQAKPFLRSTVETPDRCLFLRRLKGEDV